MQPKTLLFCLALAGLPAPAQVATAIEARPQGGITIFDPMAPAVVVGMPYSAEQVMETVQTLADGTHIRHDGQTTLMYRDSQGRTRTERQALAPPGAQTSGPKFVQIRDVVGGYQYTVDDVKKVVHRVAIQVMQPGKQQAIQQTNGVFTRAAPVRLPAGQAEARVAADQ